MGSVFLDNVDDYLAPSQACINPLFTSDRTPTNQTKDGDAGGVADGQPKVGASGVGGTVNVKPRRMRVVRRKHSGVSNSNNTISNVGGQAKHTSASSAMDIDDFGTPSVSITPSSGKAPPSTGSRKRPPIALSYKGQDDAPCPTTNGSSTTNLTASVPKPKKATVSVADCLACSGCVTSAEAVLVQSHSISTLRDYVKMMDANDDDALVFTISPASLADLVRHLYGSGSDGGNDIDDMDGANVAPPSPRLVLGRLTNFLHQQFGARLVIDGSYVQEMSLVESAEEFCAGYVASRRGKGGGFSGDADLMDTDSSGDSNVKTNSFPLSTPSIALSATETRYLVQKTDASDHTKSTTKGIVIRHEAGRDDRLDMAASSPLLTSSCPGFVCYVEKTAPAVIPNLSSAKSPMACSGALVKHIMPANFAGKLYHVAIMPCHDKKLEAGRKDLAWENAENGAVPDVDLVLTTSELLSLLSDATRDANLNGTLPVVRDEMDIDDKKESAIGIKAFLEKHAATPPIASLSAVTSSKPSDAALLSLGGCQSVLGSDSASKGVRMIGSGGYAEFCFRYAARKLFGFSIPDTKALPWQRVARGRGVPNNLSITSAVPARRRRVARGGSAPVAHSDMSEVALYQLADGTFSLESNSSDNQERRPVLKFATAYGFKNVQLVLLKLGKRGEASGDISAEHTPDYFDFIEVMACPSGCLNGGGQIRDDENGTKRETPAETRERVGQNRAIMKSLGLPSSSQFNEREVKSGEPPAVVGEDAKKMLHTRFHVVPKLELSTGATAGVALDDTVW